MIGIVMIKQEKLKRNNHKNFTRIAIENNLVIVMLLYEKIKHGKGLSIISQTRIEKMFCIYIFK